MKNAPPSVPELSRILPVDKVPNGGIEEHVLARPDERKALCARFDLLAMPKLEAKLSVCKVQGGLMFEVTGRIDADVVQSCVVTLEPVATHVRTKVKVLFAPDSFLEKGVGGSQQNDVDEEDEIEPIVANSIDLGEVVSQHLALALDPYPRLPGAALPDGAVQEDVVEDFLPKVANPFEVLKKKTEKPKNIKDRES